MSKLMNFLCNAAAGLFFMIMTIPMLVLPYAPFKFLSLIANIRESGFAAANDGPAIIGGVGIFIVISLFPVLRRMYYKLPWLFPFVKILYMNVVITGIALIIMNYGYEIKDEARHSVFFALTIVELVIGRILMCVWFSRNKVEYVGGQANVQSQ